MEKLDFSKVGQVPYAGGRRREILATRICPEALSLVIQHRVLASTDFDENFYVPPAITTWAAYLFILLHLYSANGTDTYVVGMEAFVTSLISKGLGIEEQDIDDTSPELSAVDATIMSMPDREKLSIATMAETLNGLDRRRYVVLIKVLRAAKLIEFVDVTEEFGRGAIGCVTKSKHLPIEALEIVD